MNTTSPVMTVTDELLAELEALAGAATPGQWQAYDTHGRRFIDAPGDATVVVMKRSKQELSDSLFIAKSNPATITALTAELRRLRAENAELAKDAGRYRWIKAQGFATIRPENNKITLFTIASQHVDAETLDAAIYTAMANQ